MSEPKPCHRRATAPSSLCSQTSAKPVPIVWKNGAEPLMARGEHRREHEAEDHVESGFPGEEAFVAGTHHHERSGKHDRAAQNHVHQGQMLRLRAEAQCRLKNVVNW